MTKSGISVSDDEAVKVCTQFAPFFWPIGNIPPAEAEAAYYAQLEPMAIAA